MGKNVIISTLPNISQNYLPKVNTSNIFANSLVYDNGTSVMIDTTTTHSSFANARLVVNRTGNSYIEIRAISGQSALALTTGTSSASATPTVEFFNSGNFGIVAYRPGVVSSNYLMYYNLSSSTNRYLAIQTEGQDRITINQNGTIDLTGALSGTSATFSGIVGVNGASEAGWALKSNGNLKVESSSGTTVLQVNDTSTGGKTWSLISAGAGNTHSIPAGTFYLRNSTDGTTAFQISSTGAATFSSSVTATGESFITSGDGAGKMLKFTGGTTKYNWMVAAQQNVNNALEITPSSAAGGSTFSTPAVVITSGGKVGIGTSSNLSAALTTNGGISIGNGWGTSGATLEMSTDNVGSGGAAIVVSYWGTSSYGPLVFNVGNAERMRITSGGIVGIGTGNVLNWYNGGYTALQVGGMAGIFSNTSQTSITAALAISYNLYVDSAGNWQYINTTNARGGSSMHFDGGDIYFRNVGAGTGANPTVTERMRITSGGKVFLNYNGSDTDGYFQVRNLAANTYSATSYIGAGANIRLFTSGAATGVTTGISFSVGGQSEWYLGAVQQSNTYADLVFQSYNGSYGERMRITSGGYSKHSNNGSYIGSTGTYHEFNSNASGQPTLYVRNSDSTGEGVFSYMNSSSSTLSFFAGYSSSASAYNFLSRTNGDVRNATGVYGTISSDIRLKENIIDATSKLEDIMKLRVVNYNILGNENKHIGFIAQEMKDVFPSLVDETDTRVYDKDGNLISGLKDALGIKVGMEFAILVKAIQEQQAQIEEQKADIESLKALINK